MRKLLLVTSLLLVFVSVFAQDKKAITHEDLWLMKRVGAPEVSPDGKWVVFNVTEPSYVEADAVNDLWIVPADGSAAPRKLTSGKSAESGYQWSPDGKYIAFSAKREGDEVGQIYLLNVKEGGEAQRFTNISTGAGSPKWSPDGKMLLFNSSVFPGAYADSTNKKIADERKKIKYKARVYTQFPIRNFDRWLDDKQSHLFVQAIGSDKAKDLLTDVAISRMAGFRLGGVVWSADGKSVIFSAVTDAEVSAYQEPTSKLYSVSINGGDAKLLTQDNDSYGSPQISPDGKYLFCTSSASNNNKVYNLDYLTRFDYPSMQNKTVLAKQMDRPINSYTIVSNTIFFASESEGRDMLYSLPVVGGTPQLITKGGVGSYSGFSVSDNGATIIASFESSVMPAEVVRVNANGTHSLISNFNTEKLKKLDLNAVEEMWTTSSRGKKIHSWIVKPAGFDANKKYPLFVVIHGGPASAWKDNWGYRWNYHLLSAPGYVLVLTDYTGSTGYGEKFGQDIQFDPFKGPADEVNEAAADAIKKFAFIDGTKQVAGGASYGGHLSNWLQGTTTHYKALISHAGLINSEAQWGTSDGIYHREVMAGGPPWEQAKTWTEQNPIRLAKNFKTPVLVTVGEQDFRVPLNNTLEYWAALKRMKVPSKLIVFPEENHWILRGENSKFFYQQVHEWLATYLK
jgi:dipeptidyl aminopeptidase/acylaminoacyl peptidase